MSSGKRTVLLKFPVLSRVFSNSVNAVATRSEMRVARTRTLWSTCRVQFSRTQAIDEPFAKLVVHGSYLEGFGTSVMRVISSLTGISWWEAGVPTSTYEALVLLDIFQSPLDTDIKASLNLSKRLDGMLHFLRFWRILDVRAPSCSSLPVRGQNYRTFYLVCCWIQAVGRRLMSRRSYPRP